MNIKSFSFGLGLGMALVSAVSIVLIRTEVDKAKKENPEPAVISDEDVIARAKNLGMVSLNDLPSRNEMQESSAEATTENEPVNDEEAPKDDVNEELSKDEINDESAEPTDGESTDNVTEEEEEPESATVNITIKPGSLAGDVSVDLQRKGVIDDAADFRQYMVENKYSTKISSGSFDIPVDADYDEIIEIIRDKRR